MTVQAILKIKYKTGEEDEFKLDSDRVYYTFGRSTECDYRFYSTSISNFHFTILHHPGTKQHTIIDGFPGRRQGREVVGKKPSTNGLRLNGKFLSPKEEGAKNQKSSSPSVQGRAELRHGDILLLPDETEIEYLLNRPSYFARPAEDDTEAQYPGNITDVSLGQQQ